MEVELLEGLVTGASVHEAGEIVDLDEKDAQRLIDKGAARPAPVVLTVHDCTQELGCNFS